VLTEYTIARLASNLKSGPSIRNYFGFDILIFDNCIQFAMEQCTNMIEVTEKDHDSLF
jgi:hypothetical protein